MSALESCSTVDGIYAHGGNVDLGFLVQTAHGSWDALRCLSKNISDAQRMQYLTFHSKPATSDDLHSHSVTKSGKSWKVKFQQRWLDEFPWLSYSALLRGGICRCCILFTEGPKRGGSRGSLPGVFVLSPYQHPYNKALGKDGILPSHEKNAVHVQAVERADLFRQNYCHPEERIDARLQSQQEKQANENKEILRHIVMAVEFLAKQGLPFRGHRDDRVDFGVMDDNKGNFIATLQLMAKDNSILQKHLLNASKNAKYTCKSVQNEIIHIYGSKSTLTHQLREQRLPFTIIADECTDSYSNQEVLSVCLRFVDLSSIKDPHIKECFIGFIHLHRTNASTISQKILECISEAPVSLDSSLIRGQAYDGAAVMSSEKAGVQAKIKEISPLAVYTHCYAHCLNLSIASTCNLQEVRNLVGLINEVYLFLHNSPKRQQMFQLTISYHLPDSSHSKLPGLCKTRWIERHTCYEVFLEMYVVLVTFLDAIISPHEYPELASSSGSWDWDRDTIVKAQGMKSALSSFHTISVFIITKNILDMVKSLAIKLQQKDQDVLEAYRMIDEVVQGIRYTRTTIDENFHFWYADILELADSVGAIETVPRKTAIMKNRSNTPSDSAEQHYKRTIAIPLLDNLSVQMDQRFNGEDRHARGLLSLVPSIFLDSTVNPDEYINDMLKWDKDLQYPKSLGSEIRRWKGLWMNIKVSGKKSEIPKTLLEALGACDRDSFPNIHFLLVVGCTLPISSAEAERSFSLMRRIKTYARSVMTEERFSDLALISMHYNKRVPVDEICKAFVQAHPRKLFQASLFDDCST